MMNVFAVFCKGEDIHHNQVRLGYIYTKTKIRHPTRTGTGYFAMKV